MTSGSLFKEEKIYLVDIMGFIFRAYHAIPHLTTSKGFPTNAIFGIANMLAKLRKEKDLQYAAIIYDSRKPSVRLEIYKDYKANRPQMPEDLSVQIPYIKELISAMGFPHFYFEGYEADDVIATITRRFSQKGYKVIIVSGDKDLLSLVEDKVWMLDTMKDKLYTPESVEKKFGVKPSQIPDFLALAGDKSDNIPGVQGIGEKTASKLLSQFGGIEEIIKNLSKLQPKLSKKISENIKDLETSRKLVQLHTDLKVDVNLEELKVRDEDRETLTRIFRELEFQKLLHDLTSSKKIDYKKYRSLLKIEELKQLIKELKSSKLFSLDLETTSLDPIDAKIVGISFSRGEGTGWYIPLKHRDAPVEWKSETEILELLKPLLESEVHLKRGQNLKYDHSVLLNYGIELRGIAGDSMIGAYLLNPLRKRNNLDNLSAEYLGHQMISYREITGGKKQLSFSEVDLERATKYSCEDAEVSYLLCDVIEKEIKDEELDFVYKNIEIPLIEVLSFMEHKGVLVDTSKLESLKGEFNDEIEKIKKEIYSQAGEEFNIDSPKQLSEILFEKLGLTRGKRTKTGYSTDIEVLTKLYNEHPIIPLILRYRTLTKFQSTYVEGLLKSVNKTTGRVHTSYNQTGTATGRLSSSNPNLQNIPAREEEGRKIRETFIAPSGHILISGDYSQVELRILAHLSGDKNLMDLFNRGEDIHTSTAMKIFATRDITPEMRRKAKTINFGIIYGMGTHGLSQQLKISHSEAKLYIDSYFATFPEVKKFLEKTVQEAEKELVVKTMFGRLRPVPELKSSRREVRSFGERIAVNTPVQGTAADIVKIAMVNTFRRLRKENMETSIILQVHDELVLESPEKEVERAVQILREEMEGAARLKVPLIVEIKTGKNWSQAHD